LYEATLKTATGNPNYIFNVTNSPFPLTRKLINRGSSADAIFICLVAGIGFALIPASVVGNIVSEKEKGLKYMQTVSGLSLFSYWTAMFIFDVLKSILPCILVIFVIYLFNMGYDTSWATLLMFPVGVVPFAYAFSMLFAKESTA
jgi:ATP-binding cassette subfamily A (ABC1) protein 3